MIVPAIVTRGGILLTGELLTLRLALASSTALFGIGIVILEQAERR